jgi:hypothetical protein
MTVPTSASVLIFFFIGNFSYVLAKISLSYPQKIVKCLLVCLFFNNAQSRQVRLY